jgi:hypothetical protein
LASLVKRGQGGGFRAIAANDAGDQSEPGFHLVDATLILIEAVLNQGGLVGKLAKTIDEQASFLG